MQSPSLSLLLSLLVLVYAATCDHNWQAQSLFYKQRQEVPLLQDVLKRLFCHHQPAQYVDRPVSHQDCLANLPPPIQAFLDSFTASVLKDIKLDPPGTRWADLMVLSAFEKHAHRFKACDKLIAAHLKMKGVGQGNRLKVCDKLKHFKWTEWIPKEWWAEHHLGRLTVNSVFESELALSVSKFKDWKPFWEAVFENKIHKRPDDAVKEFEELKGDLNKYLENTKSIQDVYMRLQEQDKIMSSHEDRIRKSVDKWLKVIHTIQLKGPDLVTYLFPSSLTCKSDFFTKKTFPFDEYAMDLTAAIFCLDDEHYNRLHSAPIRDVLDNYCKSLAGRTRKILTAVHQMALVDNENSPFPITLTAKTRFMNFCELLHLAQFVFKCLVYGSAQGLAETVQVMVKTFDPTRNTPLLTDELIKEVKSVDGQELLVIMKAHFEKLRHLLHFNLPFILLPKDHFPSFHTITQMLRNCTSDHPEVFKMYFEYGKPCANVRYQFEDLISSISWYEVEQFDGNDKVLNDIVRRLCPEATRCFESALSGIEDGSKWTFVNWKTMSIGITIILALFIIAMALLQLCK